VHVAGVEQWLRNALGTADDPTATDLAAEAS
jgi:hypothetical protein